MLKIINKNFIEGAHLIDEDLNAQIFYYVKIKKTSSSISFFDNSAFRYFEKFNFGTNLILQDISKVCSISYEMINSILNNKILAIKDLKDDDLIDTQFFKKKNYRKIKKKLIKEIAKARIEEISNIILFKNINMKSSQFVAKKMFVVFEDDLIYENFKDDFIDSFSKKFVIDIKMLKDFENNSIIDKALSVYFWLEKRSYTYFTT